MADPGEEGAADYCAYYCEENAWRLCRRQLDEGRAVRVTLIAGARHFAMWQQRAAHAPGEAVLWDYHVIVASRFDGEPWAIWDPDSLCPLPSSVDVYAAASFAPESELPAHLRPRFRVIEGPRYLGLLSSDRAHMRSEGGAYHQPPPPWPPILHGPPNLMQLIDPARAPEEWIGLDAWRRRHED